MKTPMKFEDLKLPHFDLAVSRWDDRDRIARAVWQQMRDHYEQQTTTIPAGTVIKLEPAEELFEHPDMPGKKFRRLKVGEVIQEGDWWQRRDGTWVHTDAVDCEVNMNAYYREVHQPAPEWRLPDPPEGRQWHRTDWTEDMLPEGWRPALLDEEEQEGDEEIQSDGRVICYKGRPIRLTTPGDSWSRVRTRRPLPAPVEWVPLGPEDVPPGSALRHIPDADEWSLVFNIDFSGVFSRQEHSEWARLAKYYEILRPGGVWEPCKKLKV